MARAELKLGFTSGSSLKVVELDLEERARYIEENLCSPENPVIAELSFCGEDGTEDRRYLRLNGVIHLRDFLADIMV